MEKDGACKMERQNKKKCSLLERVGEGRIMLELIKKRKRNWLNHWLRRNCLLKDALEQGSSTRGQRAAAGPQASFVWPGKSISQNTIRYD